MKFRFVDGEATVAPDGPESAAIGVITLNRPGRKNALGPRILLELDARLAASRHAAVNVIVIRGAGGDFCTGGDLKEETLPLERPEDTWGLEGEHGELARWMINDQTHAFGRCILAKLEELPQPVIASIDGVAAGGGFEMAIACDPRIASDRMRMAEIAVSSGFVSEWRAAQPAQARRPCHGHRADLDRPLRRCRGGARYPPARLHPPPSQCRSVTASSSRIPQTNQAPSSTGAQCLQ